MHPLLRPPLDPKQILRKKKSILQTLRSADVPRLRKRIAILGGSTTQELTSLLELFLLDAEISPTFYESPYGLYYETALFSEDLKTFSPDLIYIHTSQRNIRRSPSITATPAEAEKQLDEEYSRYAAMWDHLRARYQCPIVQNNFEYPFSRPLGNRDGWDHRGRTHYIRQLNERFAAYARTHTDFYINDLCWLSADYGLRRWSDPVYWHLYKYCCCPEAFPILAGNVAGIIRSIWGRSKKGVVLDLDNTLWGGLAGEDGPSALALGPETAEGQLYQEFQTYLLSLKNRGILLTVDSKNDLSNALAGLNHPSSVLRPEDFACIRANWEPKDRNFTDIAAELGVLPESLVFLDDNPAERAIVTACCPGVEAPPMDAPENYLAILDRSGFFEPAALSDDDLQRSEMIRANAVRTRQQEQFTNYQDYLLSLEMQAEIKPFVPADLSRIAQLTNKSNQFNLTTRRYSETELRRFSEDPDYITLCGRLSDRFGDNGIVSVVVGERKGDAVEIILWLMSCRVLKRDLERAMLDALVRRAQRAGAVCLRGFYIRTEKNGMVRELYRDLGFTFIRADGTDTVWELPLSNYEKRNHVIQMIEEKQQHGTDF